MAAVPASAGDDFVNCCGDPTPNGEAKALINIGMMGQTWTPNHNGATARSRQY